MSTRELFGDSSEDEDGAIDDGPSRTKELFGEDSDDSDDDSSEAEGARPSKVPAPAATAGANKPEEPGKETSKNDLSDDSSDQEERNAESKTESSKPAPDKPSKPTGFDDESSDDEPQFDDQGAVVGVTSTTATGETRGPARSEDVVMGEAPQQPPKLTSWSVPEATSTKTKELYITKLPNILGIQTEAFDPESYFPAEEEEVFGAAVHNLMRWRYQKDSKGNEVRINDVLQRESNTRLVEWEDGSWTLHVGNEAFEVDCLKTAQGDFAGLNGYLYLSHTATHEGETMATVLESLGPMNERWTVRPSSLQSEAHKNLTVAVRQKTIKRARIAEFATQEDPEKLKQERVKIKSDLEKVQRAQRTGYRSATRRPKMSRQYLEEDDRDYDTTNIKALKRGAYEDDEEMDDFGEDESEEEEEQLFNKKPKAAAPESSSEDDVVMGKGSDESDEEVNVAKTIKKRAQPTVFDDDDSD